MTMTRLFTRAPLPYSRPRERYSPRRLSPQQVLHHEKHGSMAWMLCSQWQLLPTMTLSRFARAVGASQHQVENGVRRLKEKYALFVKFLPPEDELLLVEEYSDPMESRNEVTT